MLFPPFTTRRPACQHPTILIVLTTAFLVLRLKEKKKSYERSMHTPKHTDTHTTMQGRKKKKAVKKYGVQYECGKVLTMSLPGKYVQKGSL